MNSVRHATKSLRIAIVLFAAFLLAVAGTALPAGAAPPAATFVNPTFFNGASVIPDHSPTTSYVVVAGDFNNDGIPDLLTLANDGLSIQLGTGNGGFGADTAIGSPFACNLEGGIVTGDFNKDGNLDFAVVTGTPGGDCNFNPGTLSIFLGNGAGGFTRGSLVFDDRRSRQPQPFWRVGNCRPPRQRTPRPACHRS